MLCEAAANAKTLVFGYLVFAGGCSFAGGERAKSGEFGGRRMDAEG